MIEFFLKKPGSKIHPIHFLNRLLYNGYEKLSYFYESALFKDRENIEQNGTLFVSNYKDKYDDFMIYFSCKDGAEPMSICFLADESQERKLEIERIINSIQNHGVVLVSKMNRSFVEEAAVTRDT